jgi:hypothetical protein
MAGITGKNKKTKTLADFYAVESRGLALQKSGMPSTLP